MSWRSMLLALAATLRCTAWPPARTSKPPSKEEASFGALKAPDAAEVRKQAEAWLKSVKGDEAKFKAIWDGDGTLLEKVTATLVLGDADAAKLLAEAQRRRGPGPDRGAGAAQGQAEGRRSSADDLALAYGKALTGRKVYEEALEALAGGQARGGGRPGGVLLPQGGVRARPDAQGQGRRQHRPAAGGRGRLARSATAWWRP